MFPRLRAQVGDRGLREPRVAHQIDREDALPGLGLRLGERLVGAHAGEIDQHVDRAERLAGGGDRFRCGLLAADIGHDAGDLRAGHLRADVGERGVHRVIGAVDQRDARALLAEQQPGGGADAPCPAGDDRNLVGKPAHLFIPLLRAAHLEFDRRSFPRKRESRARNWVPLSRGRADHMRARMDIIDLSMPIGPHFRWSPEISVKGDIAAGDQFRITRLATTCHGFSHVDAQAHFVAHAPTIEATPLNRVVGPARVLNLRDVAPNTAIDAARLAQERSRRRGRRDPAALRRVGHKARQHDGRVLEGSAVSHARCSRLAAGAQAHGGRVRFSAGLSDPPAARRPHRADARACHA